MTIEKEIVELKARFEESRASLMTQLFVTLATANGGGLATVLGAITDFKGHKEMLLYLVVSAIVLAAGSFSVLLSAFARFEHSKLAEEQKIAIIREEDYSVIEESRTKLQKRYQVQMKVAAISVFAAVLIALLGAIHTYAVYDFQ